MDLDPECHCLPCGCVSGAFNLGVSHFADLSRPLSISSFLTVPPPFLFFFCSLPSLSSRLLPSPSRLQRLLFRPHLLILAPPLPPPLSTPYPVSFCSASALSAPPPPPFSWMLRPLPSPSLSPPSRLLSLPLPLFSFTFLLTAAFSSLFPSALLFSFLLLLLLPLSPSHFPPYWLLLHLPFGFSPASTNSSPPPQRLRFPLSICNPSLPSTLSLVFLHNLPFWTHTLIVVFLKYIPTMLCYPSLIWSHTLTPLILVNPLGSPGSSLCKHSVIYF